MKPSEALATHRDKLLAIAAGRGASAQLDAALGRS